METNFSRCGAYVRRIVNFVFFESESTTLVACGVDSFILVVVVNIHIMFIYKLGSVSHVPFSSSNGTFVYIMHSSYLLVFCFVCLQMLGYLRSAKSKNHHQSVFRNCRFILSPSVDSLMSHFVKIVIKNF